MLIKLVDSAGSDTCGDAVAGTFALLEIVHEPSVCVSSWDRSGKELVHVLEGHTLCLGQDKVDVDDGDHHQAGKEDVDSVTHLCEHLRGRTRDSKVVKPVASGHAGLCERTGLLGEHLGTDDPRSTVPTGRVEGGPDVEESKGRDSTRVEASVGGTELGLGDGDVGTDVIHGDSSTKGTRHEDATTTKVVDEEENPDDRADGLDHTKDAGGEQTSVGTGDAERLEDGGRVVVDGCRKQEAGGGKSGRVANK